LIDYLAQWIDERGNVDFIIHGGDIVDSGIPENISEAAKLFSKLSCPTYLALGNHDLTHEKSLKYWMQYASVFFINNKPDFCFTYDDIRFDIICSHWGKTPYLWNYEEPQIPYFSEHQVEILNQNSKSENRILITHASVCGLPPEQTGLTVPLHAPEGDFHSRIKRLAGKYDYALILGAHTHMNLNVRLENTQYVTCSALTESPFEFKFFELEEGRMTMKTICLSDFVNFKYEYDFGKSYVQGRPCDRCFVDIPI
jgi:DNA repair exonuclease SbcCD nuclease subunit